MKTSSKSSCRNCGNINIPNICTRNIYTCNNWIEELPQQSQSYSPCHKCSKNIDGQCKSEMIDMDYFSCFKDKQQKVDFDMLKSTLDLLDAAFDKYLPNLQHHQDNLRLFFELLSKSPDIATEFHKHLNK